MTSSDDSSKLVEILEQKGRQTYINSQSDTKKKSESTTNKGPEKYQDINFKRKYILIARS